MAPLDPVPAAAGQARSHLRTTLAAWGLDEITTEAELVISELVTNAVQASSQAPGRPPSIGVSLAVTPAVLTIEVLDRAPGTPVLLSAGGNDEGGRGLSIVEELTGGRWGSRPGTKFVWAEISLNPSSEQPAAPNQPHLQKLTPGGTMPAQPTARPDVPQCLELEITGLCNLSCTHCYADSSPRGDHGTMTADDWEQVIDQAAALGIGTVQFIGGEPTVAPHFTRLLRHALSAGLQVNVYSNLMRVTPQMFDLFADPRVSVSTSWYTADPDVHAEITGSPFAWASTRANIAEAVRRGIPVRAAIVDGIKPGQDAAAAEGELRALGVTQIRVRPVQGAGRAAPEGQENNPAELCGQCGVGRAAVMPDGQLTPCVIGRWMHTGNVRETPIAQIFAGDAWRAALAAVPRPLTAEGCPPASDGNDCPPASQPCAPDNNLIPVAQLTTAQGCPPASDGNDCPPAQPACAPASNAFLGSLPVVQLTTRRAG
jgi:sulfatase maturation enzyme AslB (radical SAM superfamily)